MKKPLVILTGPTAAGKTKLSINLAKAINGEIVSAFCKALRETRPDMMVALAGYPADYVEAFKEAGVDIFIHVKANCYNTVEAIQNKIGL